MSDAPEFRVGSDAVKPVRSTQPGPKSHFSASLLGGIGEGLETGLAATAHEFSGGLYSGGRFKNEPGFDTSVQLAQVADAALTVADGVGVAKAVGARVAAKAAAKGLAREGEELFVGSYRTAYLATKDSGLSVTHTAHHVIQNALNVGRGVSRESGITITISRDIHDLTGTMRKLRKLPNLRAHLAADIRELRNLLRDAGHDRAFVNRQLKELIRQNKELGGLDR